MQRFWTAHVVADRRDDFDVSVSDAGVKQVGSVGLGGTDRHRVQFSTDCEHLFGGAPNAIAVRICARDVGNNLLFYRAGINLETR